MLIFNDSEMTNVRILGVFLYNNVGTLSDGEPLMGIYQMMLRLYQLWIHRNEKRYHFYQHHRKMIVDP